MAESRELQVILTLKDQLTSNLDKVGASARKVGVAFAAIGGTVTAASAVAVKAFQEQEKAEARLAQVAAQVTGSTEAEIDSFKKLARELQSVGVVGDEVIIAGQSQIASFTKSSAVVTELSDDLADLAVATYGSNVSQEQAIQTANNLGKALSGQLGALTRTGILVNDELRAAFEASNTEQERAAVLSQIIQDNYGGLNAAMRETAEGSLQVLKNQLGDLAETVGGALIPIISTLVTKVTPIIEKIAEWAENNPKLFSTIVAVVGVLGALMLVIAPILIILPGLIAFFGMLTPPIIAVIAAVAALIAIGIAVIANWETIKAFFAAFWEHTKQMFQDGVGYVENAWNNAMTGMKSVVDSVWEGIKASIKGGINWVIGKLNDFIRAANSIAAKANVIPGVSIPQIPEIPMLAKGGIVTKPTLAMVGEAGPEAVIPLNKRNSGVGGGTTINIHWTGAVDRAAADMVAQQIMDRLSLNQRVPV